MVNMGGTSAAGAPDTAPADETDAALAGDSPGGERDLLGEKCSQLGIPCRTEVFILAVWDSTQEIGFMSSFGYDHMSSTPFSKRTKYLDLDFEHEFCWATRGW